MSSTYSVTLSILGTTTGTVGPSGALMLAGAFATSARVRAREAQADTLADEVLDIADNGANDWMRRAGRDGEASWVENGEAIRRSREHARIA